MIVNSGTLVILDAKEEDAGIYRCVGENEAGTDTQRALLKYIGLCFRAPNHESSNGEAAYVVNDTIPLYVFAKTFI